LYIYRALIAQDKTINWADFLFDPRWIELRFSILIAYVTIVSGFRLDQRLPAGLHAEIPDVAVFSSQPV
jgi:hypothetical protein